MRIVASMSTNLKGTAGYASYSELGGLSANSVSSTDYMFPWYNNATSGILISKLCFGNVGGAGTTVTVTVGGVTRGSYAVSASRSRCVSYPNLNAGPVDVESSGNVPIVASMNMKLKSSAGYASYSEFVGLPKPVTTETRFVFPWYNNASGGLVSQLRVTNMGTISTNVTVTIGGVTRGHYIVKPKQSKVLSYAGLNTGPVSVQSSGGVPIVASMISNLKNGTGYASSPSSPGSWDWRGIN